MSVWLDIFWQFLKLGMISFGGPAAHIGYFQKHFVERLKWLSQTDYAQLVAMGQVLPGPGSSQTGFAIGLHRGGVMGAVLAFIGFTLPSFLLMYFLVSAQQVYADVSWIYQVIDGLKLLAVVVVADAIITMGKNFTNTTTKAFIAVGTCIILLVVPSSVTQILCIIVAAIIGVFFLSDSPKSSVKSNSEPFDSAVSIELKSNNRGPLVNIFLIGFAILFVFSLPGVISKLSIDSSLAQQGGLFFQAGSLVFGGGHVVLPLLQQGLGESVTNEQFLSGYAFAQAVPGPMFTMATYLGGIMNMESPFLGALVATLAIFLPGFLLVLSLNKVWRKWMNSSRVSNAVAGINAAVVGLLLAAFYQPVFVSSVTNDISFASVVFGFFLLRYVKVPIVVLVIGFGAIGLLL